MFMCPLQSTKSYTDKVLNNINNNALYNSQEWL